MKSILLIGELNNTLNSIYQAMQETYRVQIGKLDLSEVEAMCKIVQPDLVVISMYGALGFDTKILEHLQHLETRIPVIFVGTFEECSEYIYQYNDSLFTYIERPVTAVELLKKCKDMLAFASNKTVAEMDAEDEDKDVKKKILVVDDSGVFLRTVKTLLDSKYEVLLAKSGEKALSMTINEKPDLILLDYEMPEMDGKETLEQIRGNEEIGNTPVVFLTGVSDKAHILDVLKLQPQGYILKPIDSEKLEMKIVEVIGY